MRGQKSVSLPAHLEAPDLQVQVAVEGEQHPHYLLHCLWAAAVAGLHHQGQEATPEVAQKLPLLMAELHRGCLLHQVMRVGLEFSR